MNMFFLPPFFHWHEKEKGMELYFPWMAYLGFPGGRGQRKIQVDVTAVCESACQGAGTEYISPY